MFHVGEIFNMAAASKDPVSVLKSNVTPGMKLIADLNFGVKMEGFVNGYPAGTKLDDFTPYGLSVRSLNAITKEFPRMFRNSTVPQKKRDELLVQLLEDLHPEEADILVFAKDQALAELFPWATRETFAAAGII